MAYIIGGFLTGYPLLFKMKSNCHNGHFTYWINHYNMSSYYLNIDSVFLSKYKFLKDRVFILHYL